jgi:type IX secretion system PorP/SprF family membrane protein
MEKLNKIILFFVIVVSLDSYAQQDPQYTQYMYNMNVVNPAYAGSRNTLSIGVLGRTQWVNIDGAPKTLTLAAHAPIGEKVGLGLSIIADKIGPVQEQNIYADFSYTIPVSETAKLAFGLKAGVTLHSLDFGALNPLDPNDNAYIDFDNNTLPNFGAGVFYYTDKYYLGLSVPNILKSKYFEKNNGLLTEASDKAHYFLTTGYVFDMSQTLKFKPSIMVKAAPGSPVSLDLSANFLINDKLELGLSHRLDDSVSGLIGFAVSKNLRIGYAYDYTLSNLGDFNSGSHEAFLQWDIDLSRDKVISPRFF